MDLEHSLSQPPNFGTNYLTTYAHLSLFKHKLKTYLFKNYYFSQALGRFIAFYMSLVYGIHISGSVDISKTSSHFKSTGFFYSEPLKM